MGHSTRLPTIGDAHVRCALRSGLKIGLAAICALAACSDDQLFVESGRLEVTPAAIDFGRVVRGEEVTARLTIQNNAATTATLVARLAADHHPDLRLGASTFEVRPYEAVTLDVRFLPLTTGTLSETLVLHTDSVAQPQIDVPVRSEVVSAAYSVPTTLDFGRVPTDLGVTRSVAIQNHLDKPLTVEVRRPQGPDFSRPTRPRLTVQPRGTAEFEIVFTPSSAERKRGRLIVTSDCGAGCERPIQLTGVGVDAALICTPEGVAFGPVRPGQCAEHTVVCENPRQLALQIEQLRLEPVEPVFRIARGVDPIPLTAGGTFSVPVEYCPTELRTTRSSITMDVVDPGAGQWALSIPLSGSGQGPLLEVTPSVVAFDPMRIGERGRAQILIENTGNVALQVTRVAIESAEAPFRLTGTDRSGLSLAPGESDVIEVEFQPVSAGRATGGVSVESDASNQPRVQVALDGIGLSNAPCRIEASPAQISFGLVQRGATADRTVTLSAGDQTSCTFIAPRLETNAEFSFASPPPVNGTLVPGTEQAFLLRYAPLIPSLPVGDRDVFIVDVPNATPSELRVPLFGSTVVPDLVIYPGVIDFETVALGYTRTRTLSLHNIGGSVLTINAINFAPGSSSDFSMPAPLALPFQLPSGRAVTLDLAYQTTAIGTDAAHLQISSSAVDPVHSIELRGAGGEGACGHITGNICAPDGGPSVGADVIVESPGGRIIRATTDENGDFYVFCVPPGRVSLQAERGHFRTVVHAVNVVENQTTTLPGRQCLEAASTNIAVVTGRFDKVEQILSGLNVPFDLYEGEFAPPAILTESALLTTYDVLFLNCGFADFGARNAAVATNLSAFVAGGGSIYVSDWAYDAIEAAFPNAIDFTGDDGLADAAQTGGLSPVFATIHDPRMIGRLNGQSAVNLSFTNGYTVITTVAPTTVIHIAGQANTGGREEPLLVSFEPSIGGGRVVYTSFHNADVAIDPAMRTILRWLIFEL